MLKKFSNERRWPTLLIDGPTSLLIGYLFGRAGSLRYGLAAQGVFLLIVAFFVLMWPDWMWMYVRPNPAWVGVILLNYVGAFFAGFYLPFLTGRKGFFAVISGIVLLQVLLVILTWDRYSVVVVNSERRPLWESTLGMALNLAMVLGAAAIGGLWWRARRRSLRSVSDFDSVGRI